MTTARATFAIPASLLALGLALLMLASLSVVQTDRMTVSPVEMDLRSLFEPKTGQLTLQAPPYCGPFDIFCFIALIFRLIFDRFARLFDLLFGGSTATAASTATRANTSRVTLDTSSSASACASGRAGRACRRAERDAQRSRR